jgi:hypothetical protein
MRKLDVELIFQNSVVPVLDRPMNGLRLAPESFEECSPDPGRTSFAKLNL